MINLAIIDDHKIFLDAMDGFLSQQEQFDVLFKSTRAEELLEYLDTNEGGIDIVLLDLKLKGMSGLQCLDELKARHPDVKVIIVSMFNESPFINESIRKGAMSFVPKDIDSDVLIHAIESVNENGFYIYEELSKYLVKNLSDVQNEKVFVNPVNRITKTEFEVLQFICQGFTAAEIGEKLNNSKRTIEGHKQRLMDKTNLKNTAALVAWAFREGLVS